MILQYACSSPYTHPLKSSSKQLLKIAALYFISLQATVPTFTPNAILDTTPDSLVKICLYTACTVFPDYTTAAFFTFSGICPLIGQHQRVVTNTHETVIYKWRRQNQIQVLSLLLGLLLATEPELDLDITYLTFYWPFNLFSNSISLAAKQEYLFICLTGLLHGLNETALTLA